MNASKSIHKLSLVFMNTLDLDREERVGIDGYSKGSFDVLGQSDLVVHFDLIEALDESWIIDFALELLQQDRIGQPLVIAKILGNELG